MFRLLAGLTRSFPLMVLLALLAGAVYVVAAWRTSPNRAKAILIRVSIAINLGIVAFFVLAAGYAALEANWTGVELMFTFAAVGIIGLAITLACRAVFLKHHPAYRYPAQAASVAGETRLTRILRWLQGL